MFSNAVSHLYSSFHTCIFYCTSIFINSDFFFIFILLGPLYLRRESNTQTLFSTWLTPWLSYCTCFTVLFFEWQYLSFYDLYDLFIFEFFKHSCCIWLYRVICICPQLFILHGNCYSFIAGLQVSLAIGCGCLFTCTATTEAETKTNIKYLSEKKMQRATKQSK